MVPLGSGCSSPDTGARGAIRQIGSGSQFGYRLAICGRVGHFSAPSVLWLSSLQGCTNTPVGKRGTRKGEEKLRARLRFLAPVLVYVRSWWCGTKVSEFRGSWQSKINVFKRLLRRDSRGKWWNLILRSWSSVRQKKIWDQWKYLEKEPFKNNFCKAKLKLKAAFCHFSQSEWAQMQ